MNNSREKFEEALNNCVLETQCMLEYDEFITRDIAHFIWQAATEQSQKEIAEKDAMIAEYDRLMSIDDTRIVLLQHNIVELQAREKELVDLAKLTYGYLWHINAGLDAPAILNVTSITPEKCSHIVRKLWLDVLTKEQRGEGINKALEALANVRGEVK